MDSSPTTAADPRRLHALHRLATLLSSAVTPQEIARVIAEEAPAAVGGAFASLATIEPGGLIRIVNSSSLEPWVAARWATVDLATATPLSDAVRTGAAVLLPDAVAQQERYPQLWPDTQRARLVATASMPLVDAAGTVIGAVGLGWRGPQAFGAAECDQLRLVATTCGQALHRALLFDAERRARAHLEATNALATALADAETVAEVHAAVASAAVDAVTDTVAGLVSGALERVQRRTREHEVAVTLQRSLLPRALPDLEHTVLAALYRPGEDGLEVGGDWYDAVERHDGTAVLAVGDVAGRGERAAATMGRVRHTFRVLAFEGHGPAHLLATMHRALRLDDTDMSTALVVELAADRRSARVASAGHLPPVLLAHGRAAVVPVEAAPPLAVTSQCRPEELTVPLAGDAVLVLCSDGLVERRGETIDDSLARLCRAAEGLAARPAGEWPDALADLVGPGTGDDVVVLVAAPAPRAPEHLELVVAADPTLLRGVRRTVRRWARALGADDDAEADLALVATEAVANAMVHAYGLRGGEVTVRGHLEADDAVLEVADSGVWRDRASTDGRGLHLLRALARCDVRTGPAGTTVRLRRSLTTHGHKPRPDGGAGEPGERP